MKLNLLQKVTRRAGRVRRVAQFSGSTMTVDVVIPKGAA